jgi:hypothetical protein
MLPNSKPKGRNYANSNKFVSQAKSDLNKSNLLTEQEVLNFIFSSRNDLKSMQNNQKLGKLTKLDTNSSYVQEQTIEKMPTFTSDRQRQAIQNLKNVSRNKSLENSNKSTLKVPNISKSFINKDTHLQNAGMKILSFDRQALGTLIYSNKFREDH